jgi:DNA repair protein RadC
MSTSSISSAHAVAALLVRDVDGQYRPASSEEVLQQARRVLSQRVRRGATMSSPEAVKDYLRVQLGVLEHEVFCVLFLDAQHRIIALKQMFRGTVTQTSVYPREVVKEALAVNSAAVILAHNHPSGVVLDPKFAPGIGAGRRAGARSPGGGGRRRDFVRRAWTDVTGGRRVAALLPP